MKKYILTILILIVILPPVLVSCSTKISPSEIQSLEGLQDKLKAAGKTIEEFGGQLNIFIYDGTTIVLNYNSKRLTEENISKEMFDITSNFAVNNSMLNFDLSATNVFKSTINAYTSTENMIKIKNLEMSYTDWLGVAFK